MEPKDLRGDWLSATLNPKEHQEFGVSMDWFKGKSKPETIDFPVKNGA